MGRSTLPIGTGGTISATKDETTGKWRASCRFRGWDGVTRTYSKFGSTKGKVTTALLASMKERQERAGQVAANPTLNVVAGNWLASIEVPKVVVDSKGDMVATDNTSGIRRQTGDQYDGLFERLIKPALGALKINEVTTSTCDTFLRSLVVDGKGHTNARGRVGTYRLLTGLVLSGVDIQPAIPFSGSLCGVFPFEAAGPTRIGIDDSAGRRRNVQDDLSCCLLARTDLVWQLLNVVQAQDR